MAPIPQRQHEEADERAPLLPQDSTIGRRQSTASHTEPAESSRRPQLLLRGLLVLVCLLFAGLVASLLLLPPTPPSGPPLDYRGRLNPAHLAKGSRAGVATENAECSRVGLELLQKGGSAADAAVGACLCVGVLNMFSSGIGGGGFALVRAPASPGSNQAEHTTVDFRETAPGAAFEEMFHNRPELAKVGGLAVGVPGELKGLEEIWRKWGRLDWKDVVEPSIQLAEEGKVGRELVRRLRYFGSWMVGKPEWEDVFTNPETGRFLEVGETIRRPAYAETLRQVAKHGSDAFYTGPIAEAMAAKVQKAGGIMTVEDLQHYQITVKPAILGAWTHGRRAWTTPAPTSGAVLLEMMNVMRLLGFDQYAHHHAKAGESVSRQIDLQSTWTHRLIEVFKFGFASRTRLGDPAFLNLTSLYEISKIPTLARAHHVLSKLNDSTTHPLEYYEPLFDIESDHGTMHLSVVDEDGMAIGITSTVNLIFGSQVMDEATGVVFNDEMDDSSTPGIPNAFGLRPSPFNYPEPHKRPLSSITPLIIEDPAGHFEILLGGAGGSRIPTSVLQVLLNLERGLNLSDAIEQPRLHHQLLPNEVSVETTIFDAADQVKIGVKEALKEKGHHLTETDVNMGFAVVQGVQWSKDKKGRREVRAASDSRKNGWAYAY